MNNHIEQIFSKRTRDAYVATRVFDTPFWGIFNLLAVILYKDLHATPFQLAAVIAIKPLVSLLSLYWSSANKERSRLVSGIMWARIIAYLPFFFFPFVDNVWFFIFSFGLYMMLAVGTVPAWMEILKLNIPNKSRQKVFSYTQAFGYLGGGLLPFAIGGMLDGYFQAWRWLFPLAASIGLISLFFQRRIILPSGQLDSETQKAPHFTNVLGQLLHPWKVSWELVTKRQDFRLFQIGSMIIGCGLMIIQPVLPVFFVDVLNLSYTELAVALTLCKGIGFGAASPLWANYMQRMDLFRFSSCIAVLGLLFPLCMFLANWHIACLYLGYLCYGIMQSGNELIWNMSGPQFAQEKDSSIYTSVNVVAVGLRGCFVPALGSFICAAAGPATVMFFSGFLCLAAAARFFSYSKRFVPNIASS